MIKIRLSEYNAIKKRKGYEASLTVLGKSKDIVISP